MITNIVYWDEYVIDERSSLLARVILRSSGFCFSSIFFLIAIDNNETIKINPQIITIVINTVNVRRRRSSFGSTGAFSIFELLVGFMAKSRGEKIDLFVNSEESQRLDKTLTQIIPEEFKLSRSRIQDLIACGAVSDVNGKLLTDPSTKAHFGLKVSILLPPTEEMNIIPENIKLNILFEDADLLVINKPAGMVVHPAPGAKNGTLVNALLFHCDNSLSGIGGVRRPGIVHRIDKDTSGLIVVAKNDLAHTGLADQFFRHSVERKYLALIHGTLSKLDKRLKKISGLTFESDGRIKIANRVGRHKFDRKKMAVYENLGREAVTRILVTKNFGSKVTPVASLVECQLETGRTHQIRVHLHHLGHSIIGDQKYKSAKKSSFSQCIHNGHSIKNFKRQALHAATLGFFHPKTNRWLSFSSILPEDMTILYMTLDQLNENF